MEAQDRSVEARPCGELGEESTIETGLPLGDHLQELPSRFQRGQTFPAARFVRVDHALEPMAQRIWLAFQKHGPRFIQGPRQAAQPDDGPPDETVGNHRLVSCRRRCCRTLVLSNRITDQRSIVANAFAIRNAWHVEILLSSGEQTGSGKSLIRQYESRGGQ